MNSMRSQSSASKHVHAHQRKRYTNKRRFPLAVKIALVVGAAVVVLGVIFSLNTTNSPGSSGGGSYPYAVAHPGPGQVAPDIRLPSMNGTPFDLAAQRGKTVLLFFQEGLSCEPCWTQIKDMETNWSGFKALGINEMVSITTDPLDALRQKVTDEGIATPLLSDQNFAVSQEYNANQYGMMNGSADGHTFIVVGPDGRIDFRADYGGAPNYTMYVPISRLLADMKEGLHDKA
jgi:peroxiredoxin